MSNESTVTDISPVALVLSGRWTLMVFDNKDMKPFVQKISTREKVSITKPEVARLLRYKFVGDIQRNKQATRYATTKGEEAWRNNS